MPGAGPWGAFCWVGERDGGGEPFFIFFLFFLGYCFFQFW